MFPPVHTQKFVIVSSLNFLKSIPNTSQEVVGQLFSTVSLIKYMSG